MAFGFVDFVKFSIPIVFFGIVFLNCSHYIPITVTKSSDHERLLASSTIDFLDRTCNSPASIQVSEEGKFSNVDFILQKVILISRHGDRGPLRPVVNSSKVNCDLSRLPYHDGKTVVFLNYVDQFAKTVIDDNGLNLNDTDGFGNFFDFPIHSECKFGMLTKVGVAQHIQLGEEISNVYHRKLGLNGLNLRKKMRINVTPYSRTFQSALSFLFGFSLAMNIDLTTDSPKFHFGKEHGYFCGLEKDDKEDYCHKKCINFQQYRNDTTVWKLFKSNTVTKINTLRHKLRKYFILKQEDFKFYTNNGHILDALNLFYCHGFSLPKEFSIPWLEELINNVKLIIAVSREHSSYQKASLLAVYGLLKDFFKAFGFSDKMRGENVKFELYSSHDITLEALNSVFSFSNELAIPPYGSRLIFEVYRQISSQRDFVKFIYNGRDVSSVVNAEIFKHKVTKKFVSLITVEEAHFDMVDIEQLHKFVSDLLLFHFNSLSFDTVCDRDDAKSLSDENSLTKDVGDAEPDQNDDAMIK